MEISSVDEYIPGPPGPEGPPGPGIVLKGHVADVFNLPSSGNATGDAWVVDADGHLYSWNGTTWIDAGQFEGDKGDIGPKGSTGDTGAQGRRKADLRPAEQQQGP